MVNIEADSIDFLFRIKIMTPRSHTINCGQCLYIYLSRIHSVTLLSDSCFRRGTETFITFCPIPPDPFDKNSNFTCGHRIHWSTATSICLFVLLCNVCESEVTFQNPKAAQKLKNNIIQSRQPSTSNFCVLRGRMRMFFQSVVTLKRDDGCNFHFPVRKVIYFI